MNIGVGVAREYEYLVLRREYLIPVYWKHFFFIFSFFHFCNFVFSVQYLIFTAFVCMFLYKYQHTWADLKRLPLAPVCFRSAGGKLIIVKRL